jgi:hypothetical protein
LASDRIYSKQLSSECNLAAQIDPLQEKYLYFHNKLSQYIEISKRYRKFMDVLPNALSTINPKKKNDEK